jgi:hypothetical protein
METTELCNRWVSVGIYHKPVYEEDLTNLEEWLRRLKVEYEAFLSGHRKKPPDDLRARVEKLVKRLSEVQNMTYPERFRYNTLVTRFYVHRDLWRRTLMARELSGAARDEIPAPNESLSSAAPQIRVSIADPKVEDEKVRKLYDAILSMRGKPAGGAPAVSYPQFTSYIAKQTESIQDKYKCSRVLFTIALEKEAIRFTATAEKPATNRTK